MKRIIAAVAAVLLIASSAYALGDYYITGAEFLTLDRGQGNAYVAGANDAFAFLTFALSSGLLPGEQAGKLLKCLDEKNLKLGALNDWLQARIRAESDQKKNAARIMLEQACGTTI